MGPVAALETGLAIFSVTSGMQKAQNRNNFEKILNGTDFWVAKLRAAHHCRVCEFFLVLLSPVIGLPDWIPVDVCRPVGHGRTAMRSMTLFNIALQPAAGLIYPVAV